MAEGDKLSIGIVEAKPALNIPKIYGADGKEMAPEDLKIDDILLVYWANPTEYKTEASVVRFEKFRGGTRFDARRVVFLSRAELEHGPCYYPLDDILEMRFCARDSSASSQTFLKLSELYKENRRLTQRLERIEKRLRDLAV